MLREGLLKTFTLSLNGEESILLLYQDSRWLLCQDWHLCFFFCGNLGLDLGRWPLFREKVIDVRVSEPQLKVVSRHRVLLSETELCFLTDLSQLVAELLYILNWFFFGFWGEHISLRFNDRSVESWGLLCAHLFNVLLWGKRGYCFSRLQRGHVWRSPESWFLQVRRSFYVRLLKEFFWDYFLLLRSDWVTLGHWVISLHFVPKLLILKLHLELLFLQRKSRHFLNYPITVFLDIFVKHFLTKASQLDPPIKNIDKWLDLALIFLKLRGCVLPNLVLRKVKDILLQVNSEISAQM